MSQKVSSFPNAATPYLGTETMLGVQVGAPDNVQITLPGLTQYVGTLLEPDVFTAGGSSFILSRTPVVPLGSFVTVNGIELTYTTDYSISTNTLTLVNAVTSSDVVKARYL